MGLRSDSVAVPGEADMSVLLCGLNLNKNEDTTMIIAEIGHAKFALDSIESAEALLRILGNATKISEAYIGERCERIAYKDPSDTAFEISIKGEVELLEYSEAMERKAAEKREAA